MSAEKCMVCDETVDDEDEISYAAADGVWFHNQCFICSQCGEQLSEDNYSLSDGVLYCKPHFDEKVRNNRRLPRGVSLPKPSELKTSSRLSSIFFKAQSKRVASKLPPSEKNPALHGLLARVSNQTEINSQDFLKNTLEQLTQNPEMMNALSQLGQQMGDNQDLGSMFSTMSCSNGDGDLDMSLMFQQIMPLFSQATSSRLLENNRPMKHERHRRCYSDTASINCISIDCQMNIKEAAQKIHDEYPALDIFSSMVESVALLDDNVYDVYGLADLCSDEELAEEFMVMLKRDVCRRLGKRYDSCTSVS
ncbi:F-actin-monooxygenase MICAL3 isoform X5 [Helianthus annuus]|uniref:F-actin-monooxygenase MICAL3 isoform X5 n=1 Tax=Helianthus annuus TaxID=4232 RepID=UPI001652E189|nr:F-actin-monooxygenase MICAL3 isoform X5 [Helianthus annuus]